jgi:hypothetical protein
MYFDSTGTLQYAPMNLLTYSEQFDNAAWTKTSTTVSADSTNSPTGTAVADSLLEVAASAEHYVRQLLTGLAANSTYTTSVFVKTLGGRNIRIRILDTDNTSNGYAVTINPATGSVVSAAANIGAGTGAAVVVQAISNGWYRVSLSGNAGATCTKYTVDFFSYDGTTAVFTGDITKGLYLFGAQLNLGSTAFDYIPTTTAAVYLPRSNAYQDHNPATLAPLGFLIEEQRTNSIRNNTMQGAVAGTPGTLPTNWSTFTVLTGLTREVIGTGTESGISYIDVKVSGTPSGAGSYFLQYEVANQIASSNGQAWTASTYYKLAGGSLSGMSVRQNVSQRDGAGASLGAFNQAFTPTTAALRTQRVLQPVTNNNASTAFELSNVELVLTGAAIDITLRIGLPQLELGAFATSPILTTGAAATRLADVASITGTNFSSFWNQTEGTIVVSADQSGTSTLRTAWRADNNTDDERIFMRGNTSALADMIIIDGGATQAGLSTGNTITANTIYKHATAYKVNDIATAFNGSNVLTDGAATLPTVTQMRVGGVGTGDVLNGHLQSLTYYNRRLPNATLQSLTV